MRRLISFFRLVIVWFTFALMLYTPTASADSVVLAVTWRAADGRMVTENGTAVPIMSNDRGSVLLTCRHVVESAPESVWVSYGGDWHLCRNVRRHPTEDIATLETGVPMKAASLADDLPDGSEVIVDGAGPALNHVEEGWYFTGQVHGESVVNDAGLAVIHGDSGGPVYVKAASGKHVVGGIVYAYRGGEYECRRRSDHIGHGSVTLFVPCRKFVSWIQTQYSNCPGGKCPIQIRPQVVQPIGPLGFPRGPARVIGVAEPVPQQYQPVPTPDRISVTGPPGSRGPEGPPGRSVQKEDVEATVDAWLEANINRIRGPAGPAGLAGEAADNTELESRLSNIERRPFRIIIASDGKVIRDETYEPGEPVVLDLKRLRSVSGGG